MVKIALLSHSWLVKRDNMEMGEIAPRVSIATIAGYLRSVDISVTVITNKGLEHIIKELEELQPKYLGLPAFTEEVCDAGDIANAVKKKLPTIVTIVGGPHVTALPEDTLKEFESFDIAVIGESEHTLAELIQTGKPEEIRGVGYRKNGNIFFTESRLRLNELCESVLPAYDLFDLDYFRKNNKGSLLLFIESSRGCPYSCTFCYRIVGKALVKKNAIQIVNELEYLIETFVPDTIVFENGVFVHSKKLSFEVCDEISRRNLQIPSIEAESTSHLLKQSAFVEKLMAAGIAHVNFGIESGNPEILSKVGKGQKLEDIKSTVLNCNKYGMKVDGFVILGHPYETVQTIKDTIHFTKNLDLRYINYAIMTPYPGTEVRELALQGKGGYKNISRDWRDYGKQAGSAMEFDNFTTAEMNRLQLRAYLSWYLYKPSRFINFLRNYATIALIKDVIKKIFN